MTEDSEDRKTPEDVHDLLERIDQAWSDLLATMDGVPEDRFEDAGVAGDWSLKDLFGHIAFWDEQAIAEIERALAGQPRQDNEWQAMNDADHAARQGRTLSEERAAMHQAHAALLERLEAIANIEADRVDVAVRPGSYDHYQEHIPDIQQWRQRAGF
jgi:hypothetical protein